MIIIPFHVIHGLWKEIKVEQAFITFYPYQACFYYVLYRNHVTSFFTIIFESCIQIESSMQPLLNASIVR